MKRRILIVDLDCPFGINHFDLMDCDQCATVDKLFEKIEAPPFAPVQKTTFQWTQTTDSTDNLTDIQWSNVSGGSYTHTMHFTVDNTTSAFKVMSNTS